MNAAEGPTQCQDPQRKRTKRWHDERMRKDGVRHRRQDAHEQLKQGKLQAQRKDHHSHLPSSLGVIIFQ